jgi:hypothetical protein
MNTLGEISYVETFIATLIFVGVFLFGDKLYVFTQRYHRRILSFSAGVAIAYIFVHILPDLRTASDVFTRETQQLYLPFSTYLVYLAAMFSFMLFYGLEYMSAQAHQTEYAKKKNLNRHFFILHFAVFAIYVWLACYLLVRGLEVERTAPITLYALAMGLHLLSVENELRGKQPALYKRLGKKLLIIAAFAGWFTGVFVEFPKSFTTILLGFLSGGVIMNCVLAELPREKRGSFWFFFSGGIFYAVLLLLTF